MNLVIELDALSQFQVKRSEVTISVAPGATGRDILKALAQALPALAKTTIDAEKGAFFDREMWLAYENRVGIPDLGVPLPLEDGMRLLILSAVC
jgi:hypothetical protein